MLEEYDNFGNKLNTIVADSSISDLGSSNMTPPNGLIGDPISKPTAPTSVLDGDLNNEINLVNGFIQSSNFESGSMGWQVNANGDVEFNNGTFRGSISGSTIDIGGSDASSFHVDSSGNMWLGASTYAAAPFKVSSAGVLTSANLTRLGGLYTRTNVTSTGTTVLTLSVPAGALGTTGTLRVTMTMTNNSGNSVINTISYGGTEFATDLPLGATAGTLAKHIVDITNLNSASAQVSSATANSATAFTALQVKTGTVNSAVAQDLTVLVETGGGGIDCFVEYIFVEIIK